MKSSEPGQTWIWLMVFAIVWGLGYYLATHQAPDDASAAALQRIAAEYREDLAHCGDATDCQVLTARRRLSEQELRTRIHALEAVSK